MHYADNTTPTMTVLTKYDNSSTRVPTHYADSYDHMFNCILF